MALILVVAFVGLLLLNFPIAFSLAIASLLAALYGGFPVALIIQRMVNASDSFVLLAVPLFILAGNLMYHGKVTTLLIDLAEALVGYVRGGLAHVNIVVSMFFAGITGAAVADTSAIGSILIPSMIEKGYKKDFSAAVTAASSVIGVIIPPSIPMVIFGVVTGVSVGRLFMGGFIPGILVGLIQMLISYFTALRYGWGYSRRFDIRFFWFCFRKGILVLFMPVIILGGILLGVFTPTEAATVATVYAFVISKFVQKTVTWKQLPRILLDSVCTTAVVMLMIAAASLYGWIITRAGVPVYIAEFLSRVSQNPTVVLLLMALVYLAAGTTIDLGANIIILVPLLFPVAQRLGIDPVHFGLVTVVALAIGLVTPPVGACLFVATKIARLPLPETSRALLPFVIGLIVILVFLVFFPQLVLWLPRRWM